MIDLIAHGDEVHVSTSESALHWLTSWYFALPLFLLGTVLIAYLGYRLFKHSWAVGALAAIGWLLGAGIFFFDKSPLVSTLAITLGLFGSLLLVLTTLSGPANKS